MSEDQKEVAFHLPPEMIAGDYANVAVVEHSDYEFTVTLSRLDHALGVAAVVARVNMSAKFARELLASLAENVAQWDAQESIRNLPESEPPS